jgi:hypothetical protein
MTQNRTIVDPMFGTLRFVLNFSRSILKNKGSKVL